METLLKAASSGDAQAQYELGLHLDNAEGHARDLVEAARQYQLAADQGHAEAQLHLGLMYDAGDGVERNEATAFAWYRRRE
jgi:hypothetical protein